MLDDETGAEAGTDTLDPGAEGEIEATEPQEAPEDTPEGEGEPEAPKEAEKPEKAPLTPEEYEKRHNNVNAALRTERNEKRALKAEIDALRAEVAAVRESAPETIKEVNLKSQIAEYEQVDWRAWSQQNPDAANRGWADYQSLKQQQEQLSAERERAQQERQQQTVQQRVQEFVQTGQSQEEEFRKVRADYDDAVEHLRANLAQQGFEQGYADPNQYAQEQLMTIAARVFASGRDVAEFYYDLAGKRGYAPKMPDIASVKAGAEAARSIGSAGGTGGADGRSFEEVMAGLSGAAARDYWRKMRSQNGG